MNWPYVATETIITEARTWIGTPYHHGACVKGVGVDCAQLLAGVWMACGVPVNNRSGYSREDGIAQLIEGVEEHARPLDGKIIDGKWIGETLWPADVFIFRNTALGILNHTGFYTGPEFDGLIHSWATPSVAKVTEHPLGRLWWENTIGIYRYRGL